MRDLARSLRRWGLSKECDEKKRAERVQTCSKFTPFLLNNRCWEVFDAIIWVAEPPPSPFFMTAHYCTSSRPPPASQRPCHAVFACAELARSLRQKSLPWLRNTTHRQTGPEQTSATPLLHLPSASRTSVMTAKAIMNS